MVFAVGVEQGIILAIILSILGIVRRQYNPANFVVGVNKEGQPTYEAATMGTQSEPGLIVFRYDADLFYANTNRFVDDVERLITAAPDPVRCLVLDAGAIADIDYSAGISLGHLLDYLSAHDITFMLARADTPLLHTLELYGLRSRVPDSHLFGSLTDAVAAFRAATADPG